MRNTYYNKITVNKQKKDKMRCMQKEKNEITKGYPRQQITFRDL